MSEGKVRFSWQSDLLRGRVEHQAHRQQDDHQYDTSSTRAECGGTLAVHRVLRLLLLLLRELAEEAGSLRKDLREATVVHNPLEVDNLALQLRVLIVESADIGPKIGVLGLEESDASLEVVDVILLAQARCLS